MKTFNRKKGIYGVAKMYGMALIVFGPPVVGWLLMKYCNFWAGLGVSVLYVIAITVSAYREAGTVAEGIETYVVIDTEAGTFAMFDGMQWGWTSNLNHANTFFSKLFASQCMKLTDTIKVVTYSEAREIQKQGKKSF